MINPSASADTCPAYNDCLASTIISQKDCVTATDDAAFETLGWRNGAAIVLEVALKILAEEPPEVIDLIGRGVPSGSDRCDNCPLIGFK